MENPSEKNKSAYPEDSLLGLTVYSPVVHLFVFLISFLLNIKFPIQIAKNEMLLPVGLFLLFLSPVLIIWAQKSIAKFRINEKDPSTARTFRFGPYRFSRNPTYLGLALLTLGFSLVMNSLLMLLGTIIAFHIVSIFIVRREEALLHKKYGDDYVKYKENVHTWL
ncbi:MAG: isoprenylcysteine carboxylmethyltransferase family protein [Patescibacteria group bacterium]